MSAELDPHKLRRALRNCTIGREIIVLEQTTSTNDSVLERAGADALEGLVIFAEHQIAGRGQRGNRWESAPHKGLWFSMLLRPKIDVHESPRLTTWAAKTVTETIRAEFGLLPAIKAPNDIQIDGRKVAGVLVEMRAQANAPHIAIAGIGINVNHAPEDFSEELRLRAVSLAIVLGHQIDRSKFAAQLLRDLDRSYADVFTGALVA